MMTRHLRDLLELDDYGPGRGPGRIRAMEGLRGVAVVLVFLQHFAVQAILLTELQGAWLAVAQAVRVAGTAGVVLFFILSGTLIHGLLLRRHPGFRPFMARRIRRIYPAFLCVFLVVVALHLAIGTGEVPREPGGAAVVLAANLLLLPGVIALPPVMAVAWTLSFEMAFYLLLGPMVPGLAMARWPRAGRVALILALAAVVTLLQATHPDGIAPFAPLLPVLPFLAGMLLFELGEERGPEVPGWLGLGVAVAVLAVDHRLVAWPLGRAWAETVALALLCAAALRGGNVAARLLAWTPLRWLGNMSYSYYLVHGLVVLAAFRGLAWWGGPGWPAMTAGLLLVPVFAASVLASLVLFAVVERPVSLRPRTG